MRLEAYQSLGIVLSSTLLRRGSTVTLSFPTAYLKLSTPTFSLILLPNYSAYHFKMAAVARSIRPFASRALAQKPLAPVCRAAPAFRFPRGTRTFSQSPLGE